MMKTAATVPPLFPPALSDEGWGYHLKATSSLLRVQERSSAYLTLGSLRYLEYDNIYRNNGRGRGGGGG